MVTSILNSMVRTFRTSNRICAQSSLRSRKRICWRICNSSMECGRSWKYVILDENARILQSNLTIDSNNCKGLLTTMNSRFSYRLNTCFKPKLDDRIELQGLKRFDHFSDFRSRSCDLFLSRFHWYVLVLMPCYHNPHWNVDLHSESKTFEMPLAP